jgi:polyisoprenoid-binding protein YceI
MKIKTLPLYLMLILLTAACSGAIEAVETPEPTAATKATPTSEVETEQQEPTAEPTDQAETDQSSEYTIRSESSEARFYIDELLRGEPKKVEGITQAVSGSVIIEALDPLAVTIQPIEIEASTFVTDNNFRNRAISDAILQTNRFPTIVFTPTFVTGLPESAAPGESYSFEVTGELTIRDTTLPVTFQVTLSADSLESISGSASTTINRTDYGLNIPSVPQVANVSEEVVLEFDFTAERAE